MPAPTRQTDKIDASVAGQRPKSLLTLVGAAPSMLGSYCLMTNRSGLIRDVLSEVLAPIVAADGGQLYFEQVNDHEVSLHWAGRYAGSPAAGLLHEEVAVPLIRQVAPDTIVKWSSGFLVPPQAELVRPSSDGPATPK
jgi:hypothetical protein